MRSQQPDTDRERELEERFLSGGPAAMKDALDLWEESLSKNLSGHFRGVLDHDDIKGVLVDAAIRAYENRHQYTPQKGRLRNWFRTIAWNVAVDEAGRKFGRRSGHAGEAWSVSLRYVLPEDLAEIADARAATGLHGFFNWCRDQGIGLEQMEPTVVAAYVEQYPGTVSARQSEEMEDATTKIQLIVDAMRKLLSKDERMVMTKYHVPAPTLAAEMGKPINTIYSLKRRGAHKIREYVQQYGYGT